MQIYSDSELIFLNRVNDIAFCWRNFVANLIFKFVMRRWPSFLAFWKKISKKIIESRYIGIFLIIGKIIDIDMKFLNLSVIWRNYRQNYRYRNWLEIYRKIIDIEKNDLSPTPIRRWRVPGGRISKKFSDCKIYQTLQLSGLMATVEWGGLNLGTELNIKFNENDPTWSWGWSSCGP